MPSSPPAPAKPATTLSGATTVDLDGTGAMSLNSSAGVINIGNDDIDQNINIGTQGERTINIGSSSATKVDFGAGKIDNYSANVETGTTESNALAIGASYNGTVLLIADDSAVQTLTLADDLPVGFNFMVVQKGNYKIKMAAIYCRFLVAEK